MGSEFSSRTARAYDRIAEAFDRTRTGFEARRFVDALVAPFDRPLEVLDLGCGTGVPIARHLIEAGHRVTGVDIAREMLLRARGNVPSARLILADILTIRFRPQAFDAIVAWDSVFHIPRERHGEIYRRCHRWLRAGGRCLLSCGGSAWEGTSTMLGEAFFYSGHAPETVKPTLERIGFRVDRWEVDDPSSRGHIAAILTRDAPGDRMETR